MIIRGNRSSSRFKTQEHRLLNGRIQDLQKENRQLRLDLLRVEQKLLQAQETKKKYKMKYKEARQKIQAMGLVNNYPNKYKDPYDFCQSPRTQSHNTRIRTASSSDFVSLKVGLMHSEVEDNIATKHYFYQDDYQTFNKKVPTAISSFKQSQANREESKLLQNLLQVHEQLQKLSLRIEQKNQPSQKIVQLEGQLYKKIELVVDKLNQMQIRDIQRQKQRVSREKERNGKRFSSSLKAVEKIGKDLLQFKVQE